MSFLLTSILITGTVFVVKMFFKERHNPWHYAFLFLFVLASGIFFRSEAHADMFRPDASIECAALREFFQLKAKLTPKDVKYYTEKMNFHKENASRTYNDAKEKCWWLPNVSDRERARQCFNAAAAAVLPKTKQSKGVAAVVSLLIQYGLDCLDEWNYINNKLYWAQYHYEMCEFYSDVLVKG